MFQFCNFCTRIFYKKLARKMLMKLTLGGRDPFQGRQMLFLLDFLTSKYLISLKIVLKGWHDFMNQLLGLQANKV